MSSFNWEDHPKESENVDSSFSWDEHPLEEQEASSTPDISKLESAARGGMQGLTLGFADELAGAGESGVDAITGKINLSDIAEAYRQHRDESRSAFNDAKKANPYTYGASELAGGIGGAVALPGVAALKGIKGGLALGGLAGGGLSEANNINDLAYDVSKSALLGGATAGVLGKLLPGQVEGAAGAVSSPGLIKSGLGKLADLPPMQTARTARKLGKAGIDVLTSSGRKEAQDAISNVVTKLGLKSEQGRKEIGKRLGEAEKSLIESGKTLDISSEIDELRSLAQKLSESADEAARKDAKTLQKYITDLTEGTEGLKPVSPQNAPYEKAKDVQATLNDFGGTGVSPRLGTNAGRNLAKTQAGNVGQKIKSLSPELAEQQQNYNAIKQELSELGLNPKKDIIKDALTKEDRLSSSASSKIQNTITGAGEDKINPSARLDNVLRLLKGAGTDTSELAPQVNQAGQIANTLKNTTVNTPYQLLTSSPGIVGNMMGQAEATIVRKINNSRSLKALKDVLESSGANDVAREIGNIALHPDANGRISALTTLLTNPTTKAAITPHLAGIEKDITVRTPATTTDLKSPSFDKQFNESSLEALKARITPDMGSTGQELSQILENVKGRDARGRTAIMSVLEQNPAYRPLLKKLQEASSNNQ